MNPSARCFLQRLCAFVAVAFGAFTLFVGSRVLLGHDPGYIVFKPLLIYNVVMAVFYIVTGVLIWRCLKAGCKGAAAIFALNLLVLVGIAIHHFTGGAVATQSVGAMTFRTTVWLVLFLVVRYLARAGGKDSARS